MKVLVEHIRDNLVEEFHEGFFVTSNSSDIDIHSEPYYLRSCAKPLQASLLIDYGIELEEDELALICGSHAGEECHIKTARKLLEKFDIDESLLKCGIHAPLSRTMQDKMLINGEKYSAIHNNCSGKHIGFLIICKKMGWDMKSYDDENHPLQIEIKNKINKMCEVTRNYPVTTDGCGVPILSMPLGNMVKGFEKLCDYPQIIKSIKNNPYIFGGENRTDTEIIQNTENLIAKVGAGGLCVVLNYEKRQAFALKINDCSYESRRVALFEIINYLNWGKIEYNDKITTISGKEVGCIKTTFK